MNYVSMDHSKSWMEYKRLRNMWFFAFFGYGAIAIGLDLLLSRYWHSERLALTLVVSWVVVISVISMRIRFMRCPRCHKLFNRWYTSPWFINKCVHCSLPKPTSAEGPQSNSELALKQL